MEPIEIRRQRALRALELVTQQDKDPREALATLELALDAHRSFMGDYGPFWKRHKDRLLVYGIVIAALWPSPLDFIAGHIRKTEVLQAVKANSGLCAAPKGNQLLSNSSIDFTNLRGKSPFRPL